MENNTEIDIVNIFDSHAHYDDERFAEDRHTLLPSLREGGVRAVLNAACTMSSAQESVLLARAYDFVYAAVGIHPEAAAEYTPNALHALSELVKHERVVAIGEIGLDYHYEQPNHDIQLGAFSAQLSLARQLNLPVIIHNRDSTADMLARLKKYRPKGVMHCFSGSAEVAKELLSFGLYLGFTGLVTFPGAKRVVEAVAATPLERILLETDCPYMAPVPHRGKRSDSRMIAETAKRIAEIKGIAPQELVNIATENTCRLFGITLEHKAI